MFTHLHLHTQYSLLDGAIRIKDLPQVLKAMNYKACAITDHGNLHGAIEFHDRLKAEQLKPIIGMGAYIANGSRTKRDYPKGIPFSYHTTLLCQNKIGYKNLIQLSSLGFIEGKFYGKPRIDHGLLEKHNEGLIVLSSCTQGELSKRIKNHQFKEALDVAKWYRDVFKDRYYIELQSTQVKEEENINPQLLQIAKELTIPLVGTNNCFYLHKEEADSQYILRLMGLQKRVSDVNVPEMQTSELYLKSVEEMQTCFANYPEECISNTQIITDQCELDLDNKQYFLPDYPVEKGLTLDKQLQKNSMEGLKSRFEELKIVYDWSEKDCIKNEQKYITRLEYELSVIIKMGFSGYFLIVADFCTWAKNNQIPVGPGRGSGAGSLVAYALNITDLDPIQYDLLFERFLNPDRISMPDFDIDFETIGREKVIEYVKKKYGENNVCQISAVGSLQAKGSVRGVARVLNIPYSEADQIAKLIPNELKMTLEKALAQVPELKEIADNGEEIQRKLIQVARDLEGLNSNLSTHAAGIIIMNTPITDVMPVCTASQGDAIQSQYTMEHAESQGAVKFDFLGLRNLSIIEKTLELINYDRKQEDFLNLRLIPLDDTKTFELLSKGDTTGVFQMESSGMKALLQKMKPDCFEDIIALVALYRPGPLGSGMVDDYVERKHGRQKTIYPHALLENVLSETYGVMVYQEQVMRAVQVLADFSLGEADLLRRAIGKKKPEILQQQRELFVAGCQKNQIESTQANNIFDLIDKFAGYGFNKSHSAAYGLIGYQTAWLKATYPVQFMAALLTIDMNRPENIVKLIHECRDMQIEVLPPDLNESELIFTAHGDKIRFGLNAIKDVGSAALQSILEARKKLGKFENLMDIYSNIDTSKVNTRVLGALIKSGSFDSIEENRCSNFEYLETAISIASDEAMFQQKNQTNLFDLLSADEKEKSLPELVLPEISDWNQKQKLKYEKEALGFYISGHPLDPYLDDLKQTEQITKTLSFKEDHSSLKRFDKVQVAGVITNNIIKMNKKNEKFSIITMEDLWSTIEVMVFPKVWKNVHHLLDRDDPVLIYGTVNVNYEGIKNLVANEIQSLGRIRAEKTKNIYISINTETSTQKLKSLKEVLESHPGNCSVHLNLMTQNECTVEIKLKEKVNVHELFITDLEKHFHKQQIQFIYASK